MFAAIAQLGERQTEDLKVPGSIPGGGTALVAQLVEHGSNKPRVGGSSPSWSMNGWMAERSKALVSGTSLFGGVGSNPTPVSLPFAF